MRTILLIGPVSCVVITLVGLTAMQRVLVKAEVQHYISSYKPADITMPAKISAIKKEPIKYTVAQRDTIGIIADKYNTSWERIYNKNTIMKGPTDLTTGQEIVIPMPDEVLADRPIPSFQVVSHTDISAQQAAARAEQAAAKAAAASALAAGNGYAAGNCTWYVKSKRPDLPNNLGNANTWVTRARAQGLATGSVPRQGAVGQRGIHVVYVEAVNDDGTVNISEMNYRGLYNVSRRTLPANYFTYIY